MLVGALLVAEPATAGFGWAMIMAGLVLAAAVIPTVLGARERSSEPLELGRRQ